MGNILGEPFKKYVQEQIIQRQEIHGKINRSEDDITYLNSKNAWVKLGSGVSIDEKRMKMLEGNPMAQDVPLGSTLAQNNVLFNGLANPIEGLEGLNVPIEEFEGLEGDDAALTTSFAYSSSSFSILLFSSSLSSCL